MPNMSHCRHRNTLEDFHDAKRDILRRLRGDHTDPETGEDDQLSREEFDAAVNLIHAAADLIAEIQEHLPDADAADMEHHDDAIRDLLAGDDPEDAENKWPALDDGEPTDHPDYFEPWTTPCGTAQIRFDHDSEGVWDILVAGKHHGIETSRAEAITKACDAATEYNRTLQA